MYSEKVMEHFKHPRNMGEMPDADGIGKVGNPICGDVMWVFIKVEKENGKEKISDIKFQTFGCLPSEEKIVISNDGWRDISLLKVDEKVINDLGYEVCISKTFEIDYNGPMFKIVPFVSPFNSLHVTPEHPILCVKRKWFKTKSQEPHSRWPRITEANFLSKEPKFVKAKNIEVGDYLVFSFDRRIKDVEFFTKELMRLIGYYLSEGYIVAKNGVVAFAFHKNENKPINEVGNLIYNITGKKCSQRTRGNVTEIYACSRKLVRLLTSFAGKFASKKKLSGEIMLLPPEKQMEIVNTFYIGDGDKTVRRDGNSPTYRLATASEELAIQLQKILARNAIFSSIIKRHRLKKHFINGREIKGNDLYIISFKKERKHKFVHMRKNTFLIPIKKIEIDRYKGPVYNLHVDKEPNSYLVRGFGVHNCVAAIATSSIITELAKGKTLEEALKITRDDVADALRGLPPIKIHCSNLAAEALHAAIRDYYKKTGRLPENRYKGNLN